MYHDPEQITGYADADLEMAELAERADELAGLQRAIVTRWQRAYDEPGPSPSASDLVTYAAEILGTDPTEATRERIADVVYGMACAGHDLDAQAGAALAALD